MILFGIKEPQSSSKVITKSTSLLTEWRIVPVFGGAWSDEDYFGVRVFFFFFYNAGGCYHRGQLLGDVVDHGWEVFLCHDGPGRAAGGEEETEDASGFTSFA